MHTLQLDLKKANTAEAYKNLIQKVRRHCEKCDSVTRCYWEMWQDVIARRNGILRYFCGRLLEVSAPLNKVLEKFGRASLTISLPCTPTPTASNIRCRSRGHQPQKFTWKVCYLLGDLCAYKRNRASITLENDFSKWTRSSSCHSNGDIVMKYNCCDFRLLRFALLSLIKYAYYSRPME